MPQSVSPPSLSPLKVALVHDFLREYGGAERVIETLHEIFPTAPLYTAFVDKKAMGSQWQRFVNWDIRQSWAAKIPGVNIMYSPLRIFSNKFFESFNFAEYDVVISSTNMYMAKAIRTQAPTKHYCYCHTPPRSLYGYSTMTDWKKNPIVRMAGEVINHYMRIIDYQTAQNPDVFIANSKEVQRRITKFYRRESQVIYPPIMIPTTPPSSVQKENFYLFVGRLAASKHIDLVIKTCTQFGLSLKIVGSGKALPYLQSLAGNTVEFLGSISDDALHDLYARAKTLIYPAEDEDFGMVPLEAMAYGTPVIVHHSGGFLETVVEGKTGIFFEEFTVEALKKAIHQADRIEWDSEALYRHAKRFSKERFKKEILSLILHQ